VAAAWSVTDDSGHVWLKHVASNEQPFLSALSSEDAERLTAMLTDTQRGDSLTQSNALAILCARILGFCICPGCRAGPRS
jgi:hypothetical protein